MRKPMIGVLPLVDMERESYWMIPGYMKGIEAAGGIPVILPLTTDHEIIQKLVEDFDGFLLTGGQDVSPKLYGEEILPECGQINSERDEMERILIEKVIEMDKPMLGICRGIQILNTILGGTLYQDLPMQHQSEINHHMTPPYDRVVHKVKIKGGTPLYFILNVKEIGVNSYHHQAIKDLSKKLKVAAVSEDDIIEGVYMPDKKFVLATQWHPELSYISDKNSMKIFEAFVNVASI